MASDKLSAYKQKRDFKKTQEPSGLAKLKASNRRRFVIQKHDATRLHYDQATQSGSLPEWELCLQLFDQDFADRFDFDVLDPAKIIPEEIVPPQPVGRLVLDRTPDNFFAETEQVAFMTQNVPPGIDFSKDPLLQGRNFFYLHTQLKRLGGPNFTHLPINAPRCPFAHFQQDGHMAMRNPVGRANSAEFPW